MKKVLSLIVAVTLLFASCSKERKLNKRLDGQWEVVTVAQDGIAVSPSLYGMSMVFAFSKDKKDNGTVTMTYTYMGDSESEKGTYTLDKDEKITIKMESESTELTVDDYSKTDMTISYTEDGDKVTYTLKKK